MKVRCYLLYKGKVAAKSVPARPIGFIAKLPATKKNQRQNASTINIGVRKRKIIGTKKPRHCLHI